MKLTNTLTITTFILLMTQMNLSAVQAGEVHHLPKLGKAISYSNKPQASENEGLKAEEPVVKKDLKKRTAAKNDGAVAPLNSPLEKLGKNVVVGTQFDKSAPQGLAPENNFLSNPVIVNSTTPENQKKEQKVGLGEPNQTVAISPSGTVAAENGTAYSGPSDTKSSDEKKSETKSSDEKKSETKSAPKEDFQKYNDDNDVDPSPQKAPSKVAVQYNGGASDDNLDFSSGKDPKATERIISNKLTSVNEIKEKQISPMEGKISPKEEKGESFAEGFAKTKKTESKGNKAIYDSKPIIASRKKEEVINMGLWEDAKKHSDYRQPTAAKEAHTTPTNYHGTEEDHRQANEKTQPSHLSKVNRKKAKEAFVVSASMHHKNLPNTDYVEPTAAKEAHTTPTDYHGHEEDHRPAVEKKHLSHLSKVNRKKAKEAFVVSASMHHKNLPNTDYVEPTAAKEAHTTPTNYHGTEEDHRQANEKTQPSHLSKVNRKAKEAFVVSASMHHKNLPNTDYVEPTAAREAHTTPTNYHGTEEDHRQANEKKHLSHLSKVNRKKSKEPFVVSASMHHKNLPNTDYVEPTAAKEATIVHTDYHGHEEDHRPAVEKKHLSHLSKVNRKKAKEAFVVSASMHHKNLPNTDYVEPTAAKEAHTTPTNYHGTEEDHRQANEKTHPSHLSKVNRKKAKEAFVVSADMYHKNLPNTEYPQPTAAREAHTTPTDYHGHEKDNRPAIEKTQPSHLSKVNRKAKEAFVVSASMHHKNLPNTDYVEPTAAKEAHTTPTNYHGTEEDHRQANEKTQPSHLSKVNRKAKEDKVVVDTNTFHESQPNKELSQPSKPVEAKTVESNYDGSVPKTEAPKTGEKVENFALFEAQKNGELNKKAPLSVKPAKKDISLKKEEPPKEAKRTETPFPSKSTNANLRTSQKTEEKKDNVTINPPESSSKTIYLIAVFSLVGLLFLAVVVFKIK